MYCVKYIYDTDLQLNALNYFLTFVLSTSYNFQFNVLWNSPKYNKPLFQVVDTFLISNEIINAIV